MIRRSDVVMVAVGVALIFVLGVASACMDERAEVAQAESAVRAVDPYETPGPLSARGASGVRG